MARKNNDRNPDGTFAEGNAGGPGRPPRSTEAHYLVAMTEIVTPEEWQRIVEKAKTDALAGDAAARNWLSKYLLGETPPGRSRPTLRSAHKKATGTDPDDRLEDMLDGMRNAF